MPKYAYLIPFLNLIPFFAGFNFLFSLKSTKAKLFSAYLFLTVICGLICLFLGLIGDNNHWCYNWFQVITFVLLALIFDVEFQKRIFFKISVLVSVFLIYNMYSIGIFMFNQIDFDIIYTFIGVVSGICIKKMVLNTAETEYKEVDFWMYSGFFIISFGGLFLNLFFSLILDKSNHFVWMFYMNYHFILNVIVNLMFFKVVRLLKKNEH
jgi:hypothetical protein